MSIVNNKDEIKNTVLLLLLSLVFIFLAILFPVVDFLLIKSDSTNSTVVSLLTSFIFSVEVMLVTFITIFCGKKGYFTSIALSGAFIISVTIGFFVLRQGFIIAGYVFSIIEIIICSTLYRQLYLLNKNVDCIHQMVFEDDLTGLPNRKRFLSILSNMTSEKNKSPFSIFFIDLDDFKIINDTLGHQVGDIILKEVAHNIQSCLSEGNILARMGGDEFAIIITGENADSELFKLAQKLSESISTPFVYRNQDVKISATFGITEFPKDSTNAIQLLQQSDMALYRGKSLGKGYITFFNEEMQKSLEKKLNIKRLLHLAIEKQELFLEFQPQYEAKNRCLRGYEVLVRWNSPELGYVEPSDFIPIAEETGDIVGMSKWIMEQACLLFMSKIDSFKTKPILAVNISAIQLRDPDFLDSIKRIINKTKMRTDLLELEITEGVCIMAPDIVAQCFAQIKNMGIRIAMDDFGTGYSSLSYLRNFPLDIVKIDISFVRAILSTPPDRNLIRTIIMMAHQLGLKVIAEGVEEESQLQYLIDNDCDYIQGNYLGKPSEFGVN